MLTPRLSRVTPLRSSVAALLAISLAQVAIQSAHAAAFTWDPVTGTTGAQDGSGSWDAFSANWWSGTADVLWPNTTTSDATFGAGLDGSYGVNVDLGATALANSITFANSGYTLSGSTPQTITLSSTTASVSVSSGKTATIGANVTLSSANLSANSAIRGGGTLVIENGGTLKNNGTANTNITTIMGTAGGGAGTTLDVRTGGTFIAPVGALFVNGTLNVNGGTVSLASSTLGIGQTSTDSAGTININSGSVIATNSNGVRFGSTSGTTPGGTLNLNGGTLTATKLFSGTATVTSSVVNFNGGKLMASSANATYMQGLSQANVRNGGALIDTNNFAITIAQPLLHSTISGDNATDGGLVKSGAGTLTLSGANTYNGGTTINGGALQFNAGAVPSTGSITINSGGALNATGAYATLTDWLASGRIATISTGALALTADSSEAFVPGAYTTLMLGAAVNASYTGILAPADNTYRLGGGSAVLTLPNANTLTGSAGLVVGTADSTGTVVLANTNDYSGPTLIQGRLQLGNGVTDGQIPNTAITNNGALIANVVGIQTYANNITGTGTLQKQGAGTLILSGNNSYSGTTSLSAGTLQLASSNALGNSTISVVTGQLQLANNITVNNAIYGVGGGPGSDGTLKNVSGSNTLTNFGFLNSGGVRLNVVGGSSLAITNSFTLAPAAVAQNFRVIGSGTIELDGNNSVAIASGNTFLLGDGTNAGPTVRVGNDAAFGAGSVDFQPGSMVAISSKDSTAHTIANAVKFSGSSNSVTFGDVGTGTLTFSGPVTLSGSLSATVNNILTTLSGVVSGNTAGLSKFGSGTLVLAGSSPNTFGGTVLVGSGILDVQKDGGLGTGDVSIAPGATLTLELGASNNYISDSGKLLLGDTSATVALNFSGTDAIAGLSFDGGFTLASPGRWGAIGSGAEFTSSSFTGTGTLLVVPEPGTAAGVLGGIAMLLGFRRRRSGLPV